MPRKTTKKAVNYPAHTSGGKLARKAREMANGMSEREKDEAFEGAMAMIYGKPGASKAARAGH